MKRFKNWLYSTTTIHHVSKNLDHAVTETITILFGIVIKRKLATLIF